VLRQLNNYGKKGMMEQELKYDVKKISAKEQEELRKKIVRQMKKYGDTKEVAERFVSAVSVMCSHMEKKSRRAA